MARAFGQRRVAQVLAAGATGVDLTLSSTASATRLIATTDGTAGAPAFTWSTDLDTGLFRMAANTPSLSGGGSRGPTAGQFTATVPDVPLSLGLGLVLPGTVSPAALALGTTQNYDGLGTLTNQSTARLTPNAGGSALGGITGVSAGIVLLLHNIHATVAITLNHEDAGSTAANRFVCPGSANVTIPANGTRLIRYDTTSSRWRVL